SVARNVVRFRHRSATSVRSASGRFQGAPAHRGTAASAGEGGAMNTRIFAAIATAATIVGVQAGIHTMTSGGNTIHRTDSSNIQFAVNSSVHAGAKNSSGAVSITADSNVMQALNNAAAEWNNVGTAS